VTWNSAGEIHECLAAALAQRGVRMQPIVVDNHSSDATESVVRSFGPDVVLLPQPTNRGFAAGVNLGRQAASGEYLLLLNPDCAMDADCVAALVAVLQADASVGVAAAALRYPDGRPQLFARRFPDLGIAWWSLTETGRRLDRTRYGGRHGAHRSYAAEMSRPLHGSLEVDCPAAACVLLRTADLPPGPVLDERFPLLYNDTDLYARVRQRGQRCVVVPEATAVHHYGASLGRLTGDTYRVESVMALFDFADRWWSPTRRALLRAMFAVDLVACLLLAAADRRRDASLLGARAAAAALRIPGAPPRWRQSD
jgi:N-acetylglucosaminyl-diphospho-decaprenol L-rhamnosyltransferase